MKTHSLSQNLFVLLSVVLTSCAPQTTPAVVTVVVVTATPSVQSTQAASAPTQPAPIATNTLVVQNTNPQSPTGGQNQQPPPRPSGAPPAAAQPTPSTSTIGQQAATTECPTKNFIDVSTYKPKSGWPSSKLKVTCEGSFMIIETNGVPNFDTRLKQNDQTFKMKVPLSPQKANNATEYRGGLIALAVNGVQIWGPLESPQDGLADPILEGLMELCNGHALPFHFHGRPDCLFSTVIN